MSRELQPWGGEVPRWIRRCCDGQRRAIRPSGYMKDGSRTIPTDRSPRMLTARSSARGQRATLATRSPSVPSLAAVRASARHGPEAAQRL